MKKNWLVILLLMAGVIFAGVIFCALAYENGSYYPKGTTPTYLYAIAESGMTKQERVMIATLQGLLAKTSATGIWIEPPGESSHSYSTWLSYLNSEYGVEYETKTDPWWLLDHFKSGIDGYILYEDGNDSVNAATSLAGVMNAIVVEQGMEERVQSYDLACLLDVRNRDEAWIKANYWDQLRHDLVVEQRESFTTRLRDYAALVNTFTFFDEKDPLFRASVMGSLEDDSVCLGWADPPYGEDKFIGQNSARGVFQLPSDHARNLSILSGISEASLSQNTHQTPVLEEDVHYVTFLMTDGDNVQWVLGDFQSDPKSRWWASPFRGTFNMGWGISPSFIDLAPSVMKWYYNTASNGEYKDYFVVGPSGGGYQYPSSYPPEELDLHVQRLNDYMGRADLSIVEIIDFNLYNTSVWDKYTAQPNIDGLFFLEYSRYNSYNGTIVWSNDKPVISAREMLNSFLDELIIINNVNSASRDPHSADGYSLVMVGCWNKDLSDIQTTIEGFADDVRVVTPEVFVKLITENVEH